MSGSGKTTLAGLFEGRGHRIITMGDVIRDIASKRGLEPTPDALGSIAKEIRGAGGEAAVAERCIEKLREAPDNRVVVDGIRSMAEVEAFRESFDVALVAVHASPETRYNRLMGRGRTDDPEGWETFQRRDIRELGFSLGWSIALADHMVVNEGTLTDLEQSFESLMGRLFKE